jgi:hypothetical protein
MTQIAHWIVSKLNFELNTVKSPNKSCKNTYFR